MRPAVAAIALAAALLLAASPAAATPRMTPADRQAIGNVVDRFVKDAVLRENLRAAWNLAGPDLRGGTTRAAWISGRGVTVQAFPARGNDFRNAWTGDLVAPGHAELSMVMHPKPGSKGFDETVFTVDVRKIAGRWRVDLFYSTAVIRAGNAHRGSCGLANCAISGPGDYGPLGRGNAAGNSSSHAGLQWLLIGLGVLGGTVLLTPLGFWVRVRRRNRQAWAAYHNAHG